MSVNQVNFKLDAERFRVLHNQYRARLLNSMIGVVKDREAAEDITATAFAKAFEKRSSFRGESLPYTWIHAIGLNEARHYWVPNRAVSLESSPEQSPWGWSNSPLRRISLSAWSVAADCGKPCAASRRTIGE